MDRAGCCDQAIIFIVCQKASQPQADYDESKASACFGQYLSHLKQTLEYDLAAIDTSIRISFLSARSPKCTCPDLFAILLSQLGAVYIDFFDFDFDAPFRSAPE
jgi:hypothetical protein